MRPTISSFVRALLPERAGLNHWMVFFGLLIIGTRQADNLILVLNRDLETRRT
jgi:hypothetical protein